MLDGNRDLQGAKYSIPSLCSQYAITKQALYRRLQAVSLSGIKEARNVYFSHDQVKTLDFIDDLLKLQYTLSYIKSHYTNLAFFYKDAEASCLIAPRKQVLTRDQKDRILEKSLKLNLLLTSRCQEKIYNVAPSTVVKWERVIKSGDYLQARWGKGAWRTYEWNAMMRTGVNYEYNLLWVENPPPWFHPSSDQIAAWNKIIHEQDEEIRLRNKYGIPLSNGGIYRFFLSKKEQEENQVFAQE